MSKDKSYWTCLYSKYFEVHDTNYVLLISIENSCFNLICMNVKHAPRY